MRHASARLFLLLVMLAAHGCASQAGEAPAEVEKQVQALVMAPGWVSGSGWPSDTVVALNSLHLRTDSHVSGDVAVTRAGAGPFLAASSEAVLGQAVELRGNLRGDSVLLRDGAHVFGNVGYNALSSTGTIDGTRTTPLALPLAITVPTVPNFSAGTTNLTVSAGSVRTQAAGSLKDVRLQAGTASRMTVLSLSGGVYALQSLTLEDLTRVECRAACELRIKGRLLTGSQAYIGPSADSGLTMNAVQVFVEGQNGGSLPDSAPPAAEIGPTSELKGFIFVPNGTLQLRQKSNSIGKFVAKDVDAGNDADLREGTGVVVLPGAWVSGQRWPDPVLTALNSIDLNQAAQVTGDVAVIAAAAGTTLTTSYEAALGADARITGNLRADSVIIRAGARVTGTVSYNNLTNNGTAGATSAPLALPLPISVPAFPAFSAGATLVDLAGTTDRTLAAGSYGLVKLRAGMSADRTVLTLSGGVYNLADLDLADYASIECAAACELRVKNRIAPGANAVVGPKQGSGLSASDVRIFVEGKNAGDAAPTTTPYATVFGASSRVSAFVFVPNGTLQVRASAQVGGRLVARDIALADSSKVDAAGTVSTPPQISVQPADVVALDGGSATFSVVAIGSAITFQWQRDGADIPGATSASYTLTPVTIADGGARFRVIVRNASGTVTSNAALLTVNPVAPRITQDPVSVTVREGLSASFSCAASGSVPNYQWQKNGVDIAGAIAPTLSFPQVSVADAGAYRCIASNAAGSATSQSAQLTVLLNPPSITLEPADQHVTEGQSASFSLTAVGTDLSYQWRKAGQAIAGATAPTLSLSNVSYLSAGSYDCLVVNSAGSVASRTATLTVDLRPPLITQSPSALTAIEGSAAVFSCAASGSLLSYQWERNALPLAGATGPSLRIEPVRVADAGAYRCVVSNSGGTATSADALLSVALLPPTLSVQPSPVTAVERQPASFSCLAGGTDVHYQWQKNGADIPGATDPTYSLASVAYGDAGAYRCVASNSGGAVTSAAAQLTVSLLAPEITVSPVAQSVRENDPVSFTCAASGTLVHYQWQKDGADLAGATAASFAIAHAQAQDAGAYRCMASNSGGSVSSAPAALSVTLLPPLITAQPVSRSALEHASVSFSCGVSGTAVSVHWQKNGQDITGSSGTSHTIADVQVDAAGEYTCVASNSGGTVTSQVATLTVTLIPPQIVTHPQPQTITERQSASFVCTASGTAVSYRWQKDGQDLAGATGSTLSLSNVQVGDAGDYRCVASNSGGFAFSQAAALSVQLLPPTLASGPSSLTVTEHEAASFSCTASGTAISFRWTKNDVLIAGAQSAIFSISQVSESDEGAYRCVVSNSAGSATSEPASLVVRALPPAITSQPSARSVFEHGAVSFSCAASGSGVSYRWQKDAVDVSGAHGATFSIADVQYADAGAYTCIATNESGSAQSDAAILTVKLIAPVITTQPASLTVTEAAAASFSCAASGTLVSYRWQKDGAEVPDATGPTLALAQVQYADRGAYRCVAHNSGGSATSDAATLTVQLLPPRVAAGPLGLRVYERQTASFHCLGEGTLLSYQWQKDGVDLPGATGPDLTLVGVSPQDAGDYRCAITNSGGSVETQAATLTVDLLPPSFPSQPSSVTLTEGEALSLTCTATGTDLHYSWAKDGQPLAAATAAVFTVAQAQAMDAGRYTCTASNSGGTATSAEITVTVLLVPPVITQQPSNVSVTEGQPFSFSVSAQGTQLRYQWQRNGADIPSAQSTSYTRPQATTSDDGASYRVIVSNSGGSVPSRDASVHVSDASAPTLALNGPAQLTVTGNTFTISGSAVDAGSGVREVLIRNDRLPGQEFGVVLDSAGAFTGDVPLALGPNTVTVLVRDAQGNESQQTITIVVQATEQPQISVDFPANGATVQTDDISVRGHVRSTLPASEIKLLLGTATLLASGAGPDYAFSFEHVRLVQGPNLLSVRAETTRGNTQADLTVYYGSITPPPSTPTPPVIELQVAAPDVYLVTDTIPVSGSVRAQRCLRSLAVNGAPTSFVGSGTLATFSTGLAFSAAGSDDLRVLVTATDCEGLVSTASFLAHRDDGAPEISVQDLQLAPAVNEVVHTPYRLTGTVRDRALAGLSVASQSVIAQPTGTPGLWTFSVDVPLQRQSDWALTIEAWDAAGQRSARGVVLRLASQLSLEILSPRAGTQLLVGASPVPLAVNVRALGMLSSDLVYAQLDSTPRALLARSGNTASGVLNLAPAPGRHTLGVSVESAQGSVLAQSSVELELKDEASIPLAVVSQEPAADSSNIEANTPITLHFNRAIDPSKLSLAVLETAHGKLFAEQPEAADLTQLSSVELVPVDRSREPVPGEAQNFPENRMVSFYPSRDYAYGGSVFIEARYDGAELWHSKLSVRPLPTLIHGFVANHTVIPLQGIEVQLAELGRSALSNEDGNWNFGFGEAPEWRIPPGRYRVIINPGRKNARFGTIERFMEISEGLAYAGTFLIPELNPAEPFRHVASGQSSPASLAHGDLTLDLSAASLLFPDGLTEGDVHVQFLTASQLGHAALHSARPDWAFAVQPAGIQLSGGVGVSIQLPKLDQSYSYLDTLPDRMLLVGLDSRSLQIAPVGVVELERGAHRVHSVGAVQLQRLDYLGLSSAAGTPALLSAYAAGEIDLNALIAGVEAQ